MSIYSCNCLSFTNICLFTNYVHERAGVLKSEEAGEWVAEEPFEAAGDPYSNGTNAPRRAREAVAQVMPRTLTRAHA